MVIGVSRRVRSVPSKCLGSRFVIRYCGGSRCGSSSHALLIEGDNRNKAWGDCSG